MALVMQSLKILDTINNNRKISYKNNKKKKTK